MQWKRILACACLLFFSFCYGEEEGEQTAIREKAKLYEDAFNRGDAKALSAFWADDAEYVNPETDELISGREEIEKKFLSTFQDQQGAKMEIKIDSITFPENNQAVETATATVKQGAEVIRQTAFKATWEKRDGDWLLTQIRELDSEEPTTQYEHLKELEWLIGEWVDEDEDVTIAINSQWDKYKNFLTQQFSVTKEGKRELEGKQIIAWDPISQSIRSWIFDSDGGFGEGLWKKKGDSWVVEASQTLADGRRASSVNIYKPVNANSYEWESVGREVGGELLPNIDPVTVVRKKG